MHDSRYGLLHLGLYSYMQFLNKHAVTGITHLQGLKLNRDFWPREHIQYKSG
jgi:hypothetical protein